MTRAAWQSLARWAGLVGALGLAVISGCKEKDGREASRSKGSLEMGAGPGGAALPPGVELKPAAQGCAPDQEQRTTSKSDHPNRPPIPDPVAVQRLLRLAIGLEGQ